MNEKVFRVLLIIIAVGFILFALMFFFPPIIKDPDIIGVLRAGFVNVYATTYSIDLIACWVVLIFWIFHERHIYQIKLGWVCIPLPTDQNGAFFESEDFVSRTLVSNRALLCLLAEKNASKKASNARLRS